MGKANIDWSSASHFEHIEDDEDMLQELQNRTHGIYSRDAIILSEADIEWLRAGKLLAYGDGEYSTILKLEEFKNG